MNKQCIDDKCYSLSLPNGPTLTGLGGQINSTVTNISPELHDIEASVLRFSSLVSKKVSDPNSAFAAECLMFYCVASYNASVSDGIANQRLLASWRNDSARLDTSADLLLRPPASFANEPDPDVPYRVSHVAAHAINSFMSKTFTGFGGINNSGSAFSSDVMQALYDSSNLTQRIDNLATSMSNNIRSQDDNVTGPVYGIAWASETYVHVRWAWFAFPATLVLLGVLFLLGTAIETSHRDVVVWKSNNLALIFHGRSLDLNSTSQKPVSKLSEMTDRATKIKATLIESSEGGWKLRQEEEQ